MDVSTGKGKNYQPYYDPNDPSAYDRTAATLLMITKKDTLKRFELFCVQRRAASTSSRPGGEEILQVLVSEWLWTAAITHFRTSVSGRIPRILRVTR